MFSTKNDMFDFIFQKLTLLELSNTTSGNLESIISVLKKVAAQYVEDDSITTETMKERMIVTAEKFFERDMIINKLISRYGGRCILKKCKNPVSLLTHGSTGNFATAGHGTALGVAKWLHERNFLHHIYFTESRPSNEGIRITSFELNKYNIPCTLICDSMASTLMKSGKVSSVIVGADRVAANGDTAGKVGTLQLAICANYYRIPLYIACTSSTIDFTLKSGSQIKIEDGPEHEITSMYSFPLAPENTKSINPLCDITPAILISGGIITEVGVFAANRLKQDMGNLSAFNIL